MSGNHNSGPARGENLAKAKIFWAEAIKPWVITLANVCDRTSQSQVADKLGTSAAVISRILRRDYPGRYDKVELMVHAVFGAEQVACPAIGADIPLRGCVRNRQRKGPAFDHRQQIFARHCPRCPLNTDPPQDRPGETL